MKNNKRKRRLTTEELSELTTIMLHAPQGKKPSMRWFARHFGVNKPSIIKSLNGWKGIQRNAPQPVKKFFKGSPIEQGGIIDTK